MGIDRPSKAQISITMLPIAPVTKTLTRRHLAATNRTSNTRQRRHRRRKLSHPEVESSSWIDTRQQTAGNSGQAAWQHRQALALKAGRQEAKDEPNFPNFRQPREQGKKRKRVSNVDHATCLYGLLCIEVSQNEEEWRNRNQLVSSSSVILPASYKDPSLKNRNGNVSMQTTR